MKMGNIGPRAGLEPTSLAFQACILLLHHVGSLMSPLYPCLPCYLAMQLLASEASTDYYNSVVVCTDMTGKEPHTQVGLGSDIREPRWCYGV